MGLISALLWRDSHHQTHRPKFSGRGRDAGSAAEALTWLTWTSLQVSCTGDANLHQPCLFCCRVALFTRRSVNTRARVWVARTTASPEGTTSRKSQKLSPRFKEKGGKRNLKFSQTVSLEFQKFNKRPFNLRLDQKQRDKRSSANKLLCTTNYRQTDNKRTGVQHLHPHSLRHECPPTHLM